MMECKQVSELLPWFANRSLGPDEADAVTRHLADCQACRRELSETGAALEIFGEHLPLETLVGMAFDGASDPVSRAVAESHLEGCSACLEQLALVRRSRQALKAAEAAPSDAEGRSLDPERDGQGEVASFPIPGRAAGATPWRSVALAASITALVSTSGWLWTWQEQGGSEPAAATFRGDADPLASEDREEDREYVALRDRLAGSAGPRLNVPVVRIDPRQAAAGLTTGTVPIGADSVVLVLRSGLAGDEPLECRLEAADGSVVWTRTGLARRPEGGYTLSFSTASLEGGRYTLRLLGEAGAELESYPLSIE